MPKKKVTKVKKPVTKEVEGTLVKEEFVASGGYIDDVLAPSTSPKILELDVYVDNNILRDKINEIIRRIN